MRFVKFSHTRYLHSLFFRGAFLLLLLLALFGLTLLFFFLLFLLEFFFLFLGGYGILDNLWKRPKPS